MKLKLGIICLFCTDATAAGACSPRGERDILLGILGCPRSDIAYLRFISSGGEEVERDNILGHPRCFDGRYQVISQGLSGPSSACLQSVAPKYTFYAHPSPHWRLPKAECAEAYPEWSQWEHIFLPLVVRPNLSIREISLLILRVREVEKGSSWGMSLPL